MMDNAAGEKRLLFLHNDASSFATHRTRSRSLDFKVRSHLMADIGRRRRKPKKELRFVTLVWPLTKSSTIKEDTRSHIHEIATGSRASTEGDLASRTTASCAASYVLPRTVQPSLRALSNFEKEWGEDSFSAYGFALIMVAGGAATNPACSTSTFWFPFAFRTSAFLRHYHQSFATHESLVSLYCGSARELRSLALDRSLITIQCIKSRLASRDAIATTSESVIVAVLALVCYNFTSLDFDQAMIHIKGIWMVIAASGGISTVSANRDLMLMITWVDVTAALLFDTKPLFPLLESMSSANQFEQPGLKTLPTPLISAITDMDRHNNHFMAVVCCIGDLNALSSLFRLKTVPKGDTMCDDGEEVNVIMNSIAHRLLIQRSSGPSKPTANRIILSEALRLGAIIWIIQVKRRYRSYPGTSAACTSKLLSLLANSAGMQHVWSTSLDLRIVRLWLLVLSAISGPSDRDYTLSIKLIANDIEEQGLTSWDSVMSQVRCMPWTNIYEPLCVDLGQRLVKDIFQTMS